ncbi:MAG: response regulator [Eubacterium sp.]|nr:response regulator [Eubacterium sp.]
MLTALIAEDELLVRIGIASCVPWTQMGIVLVGEAEDGDEAWRLYQKHHPDILIADIRMPGISGLTLLQKIREEDSDCKVIVVTNVEDDAALNEVKQLGVSRILLKASMKKEDIRAAVDYVCQTIPKDDAGQAGPYQTEKIWENLLRNRTVKAPYKVYGMTVFKAFPDERLTDTLESSVCNLMIHRLGEPDRYDLLTKDSCRILIWKEPPLKTASPDVFMGLARYVRDHFQIRIGLVSIYEEIPFDRISSLVRRCVSLLSYPHLFESVILTLDANGNNQNVRPKIRQALEYVSTHLHEELSLEQVSRVVGYEPTYFSRLFSKEMGFHYSDYLLMARMIYAQEMLLTGEAAIGEVSRRCGFSDAAYFSRRFRMFCGMTPRQWRENRGEEFV